jgi:hypothetical protein
MFDIDKNAPRGVNESPRRVFPKSITQGLQRLRRTDTPFLMRVPVPQYVTLVIGAVILIVAIIKLAGSFSAR